jgi:hypothetical protein
MKEREDGGQKCSRANPNDRANGASSKASPCGSDKIVKWIAEHGTPHYDRLGNRQDFMISSD